MVESMEEPVQAELADERPPQPPLSIGHLMLWILGSALVLGSYRWLAEPTDRVGPRYLVFLLDQLMRSVSFGAGVAAMLVYARRLVMRDAPLPRQPGHWLLVVHGMVWPAYWLALLWVYGLRGGDVEPRGWETYQRYIIGTVLFYLWGTFLYVIVVACLRDAKRWRVFFAVSAASPLIHALLWCCVWNQPGLRSLESYTLRGQE